LDAFVDCSDVLLESVNGLDRVFGIKVEGGVVDLGIEFRTSSRSVEMVRKEPFPLLER